MKIIEKATTPNGTEIQLEDWNDRCTDECDLTIGAYPIAKNCEGLFYTKRGDKYRISITQSKYRNYSNDDVKADFEALKSGEKSLEDLAEYFWNGRKDALVIGMTE